MPLVLNRIVVTILLGHQTLSIKHQQCIAVLPHLADNFTVVKNRLGYAIMSTTKDFRINSISRGTKCFAPPHGEVRIFFSAFIDYPVLHSRSNARGGHITSGSNQLRKKDVMPDI